MEEKERCKRCLGVGKLTFNTDEGWHDPCPDCKGTGKVEPPPDQSRLPEEVLEATIKARAELLCQARIEALIEQLDKYFELAPNDDGYFRILIQMFRKELKATSKGG